MWLVLVVTSHFLEIVAENTLAPPHVLKLWFGVSRGALSVRYFWSGKSNFFVSVVCDGDHATVPMLR